MKQKLSSVMLLSIWVLVACGGSEPEPIASVVQEEAAPVVIAESESEPTIAVASPVPPTAIPTVAVEVADPDVVVEQTEVEVAAEPVAEKIFDPDAEYNPPDFDAIFASDKPVFINSYADW